MEGKSGQTESGHWAVVAEKVFREKKVWRGLEPLEKIGW